MGLDYAVERYMDRESSPISEGPELLNFHKMSLGEAIDRLQCHLVHELHSFDNAYVLLPCRNRAMVLCRETKWQSSCKAIQCLLEGGTYGTISNARCCELRRYLVVLSMSRIGLNFFGRFKALLEARHQGLGDYW